jgi:hypothetical protein
MKKERKKKNAEPEVYSIKKRQDGKEISRKEFLKSAPALGALLTVTSCASLYNSTNNYARQMKVRQMKEVSKTFTLPCGSPIPAGATCICDCVATSRTYPGTEIVCTCDTITLSAGTLMDRNWTCVCNTVRSCTCNTICTCDTVCSCNNHSNSYTYYTSYWYPN